MGQEVSKLSKEHPDYEATASIVREMLRKQDFGSVAQVVNGLIQEQIILEDPVPQIVNELDWTGATGTEQIFYAPVKIKGNKAVTMLPGMTLQVAQIVENKVYAPFEEVTTPAYPVDTRDLQKGDVVDVQKIADFGKNALIVQKALRFYALCCGEANDMVDPADANTKLILLEDDGTFTNTDAPKYVPELKRKMELVIARLAEQLNSASINGNGIKAVCRQITKKYIEDAGVAGLASVVALPAAEDDETGRPYITEGDILIISPYAINVGKVEDIESDEIRPDHYKMSFAFRWAFKWVRWDTKYLRRIVIVTKGSGAHGTVTVDAFDTNGMSLYFDRPVLKSSISNTNLKLEESTDGGSNWSEVSTPVGSVSIGYDLRHARVTWATGAVDAGKLYRVSNQSATYFGDIYSGVTATGHTFTAMVATDNVFAV